MGQHRATQSARARELLDIDTACAYLGASERWMRSVIASGELPAYRLPFTRTRGRGWQVRIDRADLDALLQPVKSSASADRPGRNSHRSQGSGPPPVVGSAPVTREAGPRERENPGRRRV